MKQAWEWVKHNWKYLIAPALVAVFAVLLRRKRVEVVDPVQKADARAQKEQAARDSAEEVIEIELEEDLDTLRQEQVRRAEDQHAEYLKAVQALPEVPEALVERMRRQGRGQKP